MPPATRDRKPAVAEVDDHAAGPATMTGGTALNEFIDENSLAGQISEASLRNRVETRPYRQYQGKVIKEAGVPNTQQIRQLTSHICGSIARLPFVPDDTEQIEVDDKTTTEYEQQVIRTATYAESQLGSEAVFTVTARKLTRVALELRKKDPDGSKGIAWVNDTREDEAHVLDQ